MMSRLGTEFRLHADVSATNGNLVKSTQDFDFVACSTYDLPVVERLFLDTTLAKAHPGQLYGAHVPHRYFMSHESFDYIISPGYCQKTVQMMSHRVGFNGFAQNVIDKVVAAQERLRNRRRRMRIARREKRQSERDRLANDDDDDADDETNTDDAESQTAGVEVNEVKAQPSEAAAAENSSVATTVNRL